MGRTVRIDEDDLQELLAERKQLYKALTAAQQRGTELVLELRDAKAVVERYREALEREEEKGTGTEGINSSNPVEGGGDSGRDQ